MFNKEIDCKKLMKQDPTLIGESNGWKWYEHPTKGDKAPMLAVSREGRAFITDAWEMEDVYLYFGEMKIKVFNKVLLDTREYASFEEMKKKHFCNDYLIAQIQQAFEKKGSFENEFYQITKEV